MNIALIGMMGSGKTTIGKLLNLSLTDYTFVDTDFEITSNENFSINDIFLKFGEGYFRKIETETLKDILMKDKQIISTGGGIIKSDENLELLKDNSIVFYLKASENEIYERVKNNKERPLLNVENMREQISLLLKNREDRYKKAHYTINTDNKTPENITKEILEIINDYSRS